MIRDDYVFVCTHTNDIGNAVLFDWFKVSLNTVSFTLILLMLYLGIMSCVIGYKS